MAVYLLIKFIQRLMSRRKLLKWHPELWIEFVKNKISNLHKDLPSKVKPLDLLNIKADCQNFHPYVKEQIQSETKKK